MAVLNVAVDLHNTVGSGKEFQSEMVCGKKEFLNMSLLQLYTLIDLEFLFLDGRGLNAIWGSVGIATRPLMILKVGRVSGSFCVLPMAATWGPLA